MHITVLTLFPDIFTSFLKTSIVGRAIKKGVTKITIVDFRQFSSDKHHKVDDYQYGGGGGMIIQLPAIVKAIQKYRTKNTKVVLLSPQGKLYKQATAQQFSKTKHMILIAGHYEGFDERLMHYVDEIISIGDYVLMGGEVAAMVVIESTVRLLTNAISPQSLDNESFQYNLLDYPVYTKPLVFEKHKVPQVLLSGNHQKISAFRQKQQIIKTRKMRPDLYRAYLKETKYEPQN
jgi:tRNA (guanine37-N1)-methyltransferase